MNMSKQSIKDYYKTVVRRYRNSDKKTKPQVLDEFCEVCGYNRKYAIRKLNTRKRNHKRYEIRSHSRRGKNNRPYLVCGRNNYC